ncbi:hypothetical protein EYZ11_009644 [Aspergillus tanneri]|uniref:Uncharacterized protein n=1 Tax=Aspergillus tanneri TaxID=1220188 RepID=A0A4S3J7D8_9EURO|nr:hypothetical protein EYZ11_009644 [Aspergillus tanneri]
MPPKRSNTAEGLTARSMPYDLRHTSIPRVEPPPAAGQNLSRQPSRQPSLPPPKRVRFSAREAPNPSDADAAEDEEELLAQRLFTTKERYNQFVSARKIAEARKILPDTTRRTFDITDFTEQLME